MVVENGKRKARRINFDCPSDLADAFERTVKRRGSDVSKALRAYMDAVVRKFGEHRVEPLAEVILEENPGGVWGEPRMPDEEEGKENSDG